MYNSPDGYNDNVVDDDDDDAAKQMPQNNNHVLAKGMKSEILVGYIFCTLGICHQS